MRNHVFISHSHDDSPAADLIVKALEERGVICWIAPRDVDAGGSYAESILNAIESACCFVLIYSQSSNVSSHVMREVERALKFGVNIVPVRFDDSTPSKSLDYLLATVHWLAIAPDARDRSIVRAAEQILAAVAKSQSPGPAAEPDLVPASRTVATPIAPPPKQPLLWIGAAVALVLVAGLIGFLVLRNRAPVQSTQKSGVAASAPAASSTGSAPVTSQVNNAETPLAVTRRYFDLLGKRNWTAAYDLLSTNFHNHLAVTIYSRNVGALPRARLVEATITSQSERNASVAAVIAEANPRTPPLPQWRCPIELVMEGGSWRIDSMQGLLAASGYPLGGSSKASNEGSVQDAGQSAPASAAARPLTPPSGAAHLTTFGVVQDPSGTANVRQEPFGHSKLVTVLKNGDAVEIDRTENGWAHVILASGRDGFIQKNRLNITPEKP